LAVRYISSGPSPGCSSRGAKNQKGGHIFKIQYWMYAATGGPNVKWGAPISNGGPGTTAPPAGEGPAFHPNNLVHLRLCQHSQGAQAGSICRMQLRPSNIRVSPDILRLF